MTPRRSLDVSFKEIVAIEIRCGCGGVTSIPLPKNNPTREFDCRACNARLWDGDVDATFMRVQALFRALSNWQADENKLFELGFSLTEESVSKP